MNILTQVLQSLSVFNWLDFLLVAVFLFYAFEGFERGFMSSLLDLISFVVSFGIGLKFYPYLAKILGSSFSIPIGFSNALGFFILAILAETILTSSVRFIRRLFTQNIQSASDSALDVLFAKADHLFGIVPSIISAAILISFLLTIIVSLPVSSYLKQAVYASKIGNALLLNTQGLERDLKNIFGQTIDGTLNFITVEPKSNELITLSFKTSNFSVDSASEQKMFGMLNLERTKRGLSALSFDIKLQEVGRSHCEDMFRRGYFSHYTPEGLSPFDRMGNAGVDFTYAGENLAFAPNTDLAMQGLMNSPGHRANILSVSFGRVGIGVIDGGIYGEMFCQEFTN